MNSIFLANLVDRLHPSQRLQANLRLELRRVNLPLLRFLHIFSFLVTAHSLIRCLENGDHFTLWYCLYFAASLPNSWPGSLHHLTRIIDDQNFIDHDTP